MWELSEPEVKSFRSAWLGVAISGALVEESVTGRVEQEKELGLTRRSEARGRRSRRRMMPAKAQIIRNFTEIESQRRRFVVEDESFASEQTQL